MESIVRHPDFDFAGGANDIMILRLRHEVACENVQKLPLGPLATTLPFEESFGNFLVVKFHFLKA